MIATSHNRAYLASCLRVASFALACAPAKATVQDNPEEHIRVFGGGE
jgi:hypothetical protein